MIKHNISESVKKLLHDRQFVLWCFAPTNELDELWRNWVENHPEKENDLLEAQQLLKATKLNNHVLSAEDSKILYYRLQESVKHRKKTQQRHIIYSVAAACFTFFCLLGSWIYLQTDNKPSVYVAEAISKIDSAQTEVELVLTNHDKMFVANKATIKLNQQGNVNIKKEEITAVENDSIQKEATEQVAERKMNVLKVPKGRHSSVVLADGTKVWVNSGTVLSFPNVFEEDNRTIYVDGEIYLEVTKDVSRPFYVKTSQMDVRVLGTSFNVTAYDDEHNQSVILTEGSVEVRGQNGLKRKIQPQDRLVLEKNKMDVSRVNVYDYISWKDGVFLFKNKSLAYVAQRLSRYYRIHVECTPEVENYTCSGKLVLFDDLNSVLKTLKESLPISYEIEENVIKLSTNLKKDLPMN